MQGQINYKNAIFLLTFCKSSDTDTTWWRNLDHVDVLIYTNPDYAMCVPSQNILRYYTNGLYRYLIDNNFLKMSLLERRQTIDEFIFAKGRKLYLMKYNLFVTNRVHCFHSVYDLHCIHQNYFLHVQPNT